MAAEGGNVDAQSKEVLHFYTNKVKELKKI
jgi:hypothetical protein